AGHEQEPGTTELAPVGPEPADGPGGGGGRGGPGTGPRRPARRLGRRTGGTGPGGFGRSAAFRSGGHATTVTAATGVLLDLHDDRHHRRPPPRPAGDELLQPAPGVAAQRLEVERLLVD